MSQRQQTGGRLKATLFLLGALGVAGITSYGVWMVMQQARDQVKQAKNFDKVQVVVAKHDLLIGVPITEADIEVRDMLPGSVPGDYVFSDTTAFRRSADPTDPNANNDRPLTPKSVILAGEPVRSERIAGFGGGLNALIKPGMRAMTIEVGTQSSLAGFLVPGNRVDVIVTIKPDERFTEAKWVTETILQDVTVLAVGDLLDGGTTSSQITDAVKKGTKGQAKGKKGEAEDKEAAPKQGPAARKSTKRTKPSVTLQVTPEDAERLALSASRGDVHLVLRSDNDNLTAESSESRFMTTREILGFADDPAKTATIVTVPTKTTRPPPETPKGQSAEVIQGSTTSTIELDASGQKVEEQGGRRR